MPALWSTRSSCGGLLTAASAASVALALAWPRCSSPAEMRGEIVLWASGIA
jgi:hypothetical protein